MTIPFELNKVHCADCLEAMKRLPDKCVDLVLTDPPYGHNNNCCDDKREDLIGKWECVLGKMTREDCAKQARPIANDGKEQRGLFREFVVAACRVLREGGVLCTCCGGGGGHKGLQFVDWSKTIDELLTFKAAVVWDKGKIGMGWHYRRSYEMVLVAHKGASCKWRDTTLQVENIIRHIPKIIPLANEHPTLKPVALMEHFIMLHTDPDDLILDPFMGSGTTGVAAIQTGRRFLGFEISPEYTKLANDRCEAAKRGLKLNEYRGGQQTLFGGAE